MDVICIGEMLIDFTPCSESLTYKANPGGAPANVIISVSKNGLDAGFIGRLGNDDFGRLLSDILKKEKVKLLCPRLTDEAVTTLAFVTLTEDGERSFTFVRKPGADLLLSEDDINIEDIKSTRILNAGSVGMSANPSADAIVYTMKIAHKLGKIVAFDINYRDKIWSTEACAAQVERVLMYIDLLKISDEETEFVGGIENIPVFMTKYNIKVVVLTLGAGGAEYFLRNAANDVVSGYVSGHKVKAVDATGAGDAFWGSFLSKLLIEGVNCVADINEEILYKAVSYGNIAGSICVQKMGGIPAIPTREEIEAIALEEKDNAF